jgi:hypothetical protein
MTDPKCPECGHNHWATDPCPECACTLPFRINERLQRAREKRLNPGFWSRIFWR